jgi:hypothetical protein
MASPKTAAIYCSVIKAIVVAPSTQSGRPRLGVYKGTPAGMSRRMVQEGSHVPAGNPAKRSGGCMSTAAAQVALRVKSAVMHGCLVDATAHRLRGVSSAYHETQ